jgi:predicted amidohydrolase
MRGRRKLLKAALGGVAFSTVTIAKAETPITLALLHLAPWPGEVGQNKRMIESAVQRAATMGAKFIVTPELVVSGYGFRDRIGIDWIARDQAALLDWAGTLARQATAYILLGTPEAAPAGRELFNSMILFGPDGARLGHHRKINVLKVGSESWSVPGDRATVMTIPGIGRMGLFVCADMYSKRLVDETAAEGVDLLISSAAWAPGLHGPDGEWERASLETGRPVLVCNRTGVDVLDFKAAQSVVAVGGGVSYSHSSPESAIIVVDWNPLARQLTNWRAA